MFNPPELVKEYNKTLFADDGELPSPCFKNGQHSELEEEEETGYYKVNGSPDYVVSDF